MGHAAVALRADRDLGLGSVAPARPTALFIEYEEPLAVDLEGGLVAAELQAAVVEAAPVGACVRDQEFLRVVDGGGRGVWPFRGLDEVVWGGSDRAPLANEDLGMAG